MSATEGQTTNNTTSVSQNPILCDKDVEHLSHGLLTIYEKPFKTIETELEELVAKQNKLIDAIQVINNNKDKNYRSKLLILEEICARINGLIVQVKNNHARMIDITKTVKTMKTSALKVQKTALEQATKRQEQLLKEQNLIATRSEPETFSFTKNDRNLGFCAGARLSRTVKWSFLVYKIFRDFAQTHISYRKQFSGLLTTLFIF
uniref:Uncharacterized protein n=2 Tax=Cacopsylla melanoneura TaxID=428564 RepID=A0A8D8WKJ3_9HEMI